MKGNRKVGVLHDVVKAYCKGLNIAFTLCLTLTFVDVFPQLAFSQTQSPLQELEEMNLQLQRKIDELRELLREAEELQDALRRMEELKNKIEEVEEKMATRPPLPRIEALIRGGYIGRTKSPAGLPKNEFLVREIQLGVGGSVMKEPDTSFFFEAQFSEPGEEVRLNDAVLTLELMKGVKLAIGQLRVPLNRPAVSARWSLFLDEPRSAGTFQALARDRGANLILELWDGHLLYEQAVTNGNGIRTNQLGNDDNDFLAQGRLLWFVRGKWPVPLPYQSDLDDSPWNTYFKTGWASGRFTRKVTQTLEERMTENTWNVGQAIIGHGLYLYWQYGAGETTAERGFDSKSFFVTSGYAFPLRRVLPFLEHAPPYIRGAWLEPKIQYETLRFADPTLFNRPNREILRFGFNYYPFDRLRNIRLMTEYEFTAIGGTHTEALSLFFHYAF